MRTILLLTTIAASLGLASTARAECRQEDDAKPLVTRIEVIGGKRTIVIEKEIVICGRPARPAVAYVTGPKQVDYNWERLQQKLVPKILDSVKQLNSERVVERAGVGWREVARPRASVSEGGSR